MILTGADLCVGPSWDGRLSEVVSTPADDAAAVSHRTGMITPGTDLGVGLGWNGCLSISVIAPAEQGAVAQDPTGVSSTSADRLARQVWPSPFQWGWLNRLRGYIPQTE